MKIQTAIREESYKHCVPGEGPGFGSSFIGIECARGSFMAFQIILECDERCLVSLTDNPSFSIYPGTPVLRAESLIVGLGPADIRLVTPMEDDNGVLRWDCIENKDYFLLEKDESCVLWCETGIPADTASGIYKGYFRIYSHHMFGMEIPECECSVDLTVKNIVLPAPEEFSMHLNLWQHLSNISRKHDVLLFSNQHFSVIENYVASLARLGQKNITVIASEVPWSGQRTFNDLDEPTDLFEYSYIRTFRNPDGSFVYDYSVMDRYISLCMSYGIDKRIEVFGLCGIWMTEEKGFGKAAVDFPDGVRVRFLDRVTGCYGYMETEGQLRDFIRSLYNHFLEKDLIDIVRVTADEPADMEIYRKTIGIILEEGPLFRFSIAINKAEFTTEFDSVMSDAVPSLKCLSQDYDFIKKNLMGRPDKSLSWYVCCRPHYPNTFLKSHLLESRLLCLLTYWLGLDGFLRWNYTVWPEKPRECLIFRSPEWLSGDMNFVYPGNDGKPLLSLRYKALLRGMEDFELLHMADAATETTRAFIGSTLLKGTTLQELSDLGYDESEPEKPFSLDYRKYEALRTLLYDLLC